MLENENILLSRNLLFFSFSFLLIILFSKICENYLDEI